MKRNLKALGLALVAAFAMSVVAATAAQAEQASFTAAEFPAVITGEEKGVDNYFEITPNGEPSKTECDDVTYEATLAGESTELTVTPHYTECVATGVLTLNATIDLNGCHYIFKAGTATPEENDAHGSVEIVCPPEQQIEVTAGSGPLCDVDVPPQEVGGEGGITFTNLENGHVTVDVDITGEITYRETDTGAFCPFSNEELTHDGNFVSTVTVSGYEDLGTHESESTPGTNEYTEGEPLDVHVK